MKPEPEAKKPLVCGIYTRVSTTEGLGQDFTSLDSQRESAESYIQSQKTEGWIASPERYDDAGFTGANTERPALQKLITDIKEGRINCVVVYKVDRLSRSLLDFSQLLEFFDKNKAAFVSVTQHFNTNTSMGRLTLNILLSFAQFEREIISERTRDKMGAARKKGKWVGGRPPLGYNIDKVNHKIVINPEEARLIRKIFSLYLEKRSLLATTKAMNDDAHQTKSFTSDKGIRFGGLQFKNTGIQLILKNVLYTGKVSYHDEIYEGEQEAIITEEDFQKVQQILADNWRERKVAGTAKSIGLLSQILRCKACNSSTYYIYSQKGTNRYHYYVCLNAQKRGYHVCPTRNVAAHAIENKFMECLRTLVTDSTFDSERWNILTLEQKITRVKSIVKKADFDAHNGTLEIVLLNDESHSFPLRIEELKRIPAHKKSIEVGKEPCIRQDLILAHQIKQLHEEKGHSLRRIAEWVGMAHARLCQTMNMLNLSPAIQEAIIFSDEKSLFKIPEYKMRPITAEGDWEKQRTLWDSLLQSISQ